MQHFAAGFARRDLRVVRERWDFFRQIGRNFFLDRIIELARQLGILRAPILVGFLPLAVSREQRFFVLGEIVAHFLRNEVMLVRQSQPFPAGVDIFYAGLAVRLVRPGHFRNAFADDRFRDNHLRLSVVAFLRGVQRVEKFGHVVTIDFLDVEAVCFEAFRGVVALARVGHGIEGDGIVVVNQN